MTGTATCDRCGHEEPEATAALTWTTSVDRGERHTWCVACSREHLRALEGKLDPEWW